MGEISLLSFESPPFICYYYSTPLQPSKIQHQESEVKDERRDG
jgi:hypothetical protein